MVKIRQELFRTMPNMFQTCLSMKACYRCFNLKKIIIITMAFLFDEVINMRTIFLRFSLYLSSQVFSLIDLQYRSISLEYSCCGCCC